MMKQDDTRTDNDTTNAYNNYAYTARLYRYIYRENIMKNMLMAILIVILAMVFVPLMLADETPLPVCQVGQAVHQRYPYDNSEEADPRCFQPSSNPQQWGYIQTGDIVPYPIEEEEPDQVIEEEPNQVNNERQEIEYCR